jgi:DNA-repair protein complementing XP-A cells
MELTEEQKERIKRNRERALEIQRKRKVEQLATLEGGTKGRGDSLSSGASKRQKVEEGDEDEKDVELEDFEVGASPFVSKKEAMQTYCLPEGTLAVCSFVEKENPRNKKWAPLKLYNRAEIRRRARARFGGLEGLVEERQKRVEKRFRKDMETAKNVFK